MMSWGWVATKLPWCEHAASPHLQQLRAQLQLCVCRKQWFILHFLWSDDTWGWCQECDVNGSRIVTSSAFGEGFSSQVWGTMSGNHNVQRKHSFVSIVLSLVRSRIILFWEALLMTAAGRKVYLWMSPIFTKTSLNCFSWHGKTSALELIISWALNLVMHYL